MVAKYNIFGRQIGSHYLAMAVLGSITAVTFAALGGGSAAKKEQGPPINASNPDEEKFIRDFLKNAEAGEKSGAGAGH